MGRAVHIARLNDTNKKKLLTILLGSESEKFNTYNCREVKSSLKAIFIY